MNMRSFIDIVEARPRSKAAMPTDTAQTVYEQARSVATKLGQASHVFGREWDRVWVDSLKTIMLTHKKEHETAEAAEAAEAKRYEEPYTPQPYVLAEVLPDITQRWWQFVVQPLLEEMEDDIGHEYGRYVDDHPRVEMSDTLTLLQSEKSLVSTIAFKGGAGLDGFQHILTALDGFAFDLQRAHDIDPHRPCTRSTEKFIKAMLPAILFASKLMGATTSS